MAVVTATATILRGIMAVPAARSIFLPMVQGATRIPGRGLMVMVPGSSVIGAVLKKVWPHLATLGVIEFLLPDSLMGEFGDLLQPMMGGGGGSTMHPGTVTKTWTANGTPFVRLDDGRLGAQKRDGSWKYWKPKKPIVLMPGGAGNLRTLLKADAAAERQLKRLQKAINRRFPSRRRAPAPRALPPRAGDVYITEHGQGSVRTPR